MKRSVTDIIRRGFDNTLANWPLLLIRKALNPKGLGLLLAGTVRRGRVTGGERYAAEARELAETLIRLRAPGYSGACWGYPFPWQSRAFYLPKGTPTIVNTAFVAHALLDVARFLKEERYASVARSACTFVLKDLARTEEEGAKITVDNGAGQTIKLTGNVQGKGPHTGTLRHRGWKATDVKLPTAIAGHDTHIVAQAEVEL